MDVAICVPTYKKADVVDDVLNRAIKLYAKMGIDLYYYDSSPDDEVKKVVEKYINQGYTNIKYISVKKDFEKKIAMIYTERGMDKDYEYIWLVKDRVWFEEPVLYAVEKAIHEKYDVIFLAALWCYAHPNVGTKTYDDAREFYLDWGHLVTSMDVTILRCRSILEGLTYEVLEKYNKSFPHYQLIFTQLSYGNKKVRVLAGDNIAPCNSKLVETAALKENPFQVWKDSWIEVNERLPECYNIYKAAVIKYAGIMPFIFGSVDSLLEQKRRGELVPEKLDSILKNWEKVSDIPKETVIAIANGTYDKKHDLGLVPIDKDELLKLLVQMTELLKHGNMRKEQIPYNDIFNCIMRKILNRFNGNSNIVNITYGAVEDILIYIRDIAETYEEINRAFQMLITIILVL